MRAHAVVILAGALVLSVSGPVSAQQTIKIGELNSYKSQPAFLDPYKKGWEMAVEEINAAGGVLGKKLEIVSRDDGANPGDAVRVAEELTTGGDLNILCGTFLSNVGLAVTEFAGKKKVFFLAAEPLTDKITWANGNRYTFRLRPSTYMQVAMLLPDALAAKKKRWALVYPNFEYGQSAAAAFKDMMKAKQPDVEFVTEQASPLGKIDAGAVAQAIDDAKPDAIFSALFGGDLTKFVREGGTRGTFKDRVVVDLLGGEPEYLDPLKDEAPAGWIVTGYPWNEIDIAGEQGFRRRLSETLQRLSAARIDRRLPDDQVACRRHRQGRLGRYRQARRRLRRLEGRRPLRAVRLPRQRPPGDAWRFRRQTRAQGRPRHHGRFQICRWRQRAAVRCRGEEAAAGVGGLDFWVEHDLFGKPATTFPDHALRPEGR